MHSRAYRCAESGAVRTGRRASFSSRIALVPTSQHKRRGSASTDAMARAWYFSPCVRLRSAITLAHQQNKTAWEPITTLDEDSQNAAHLSQHDFSVFTVPTSVGYAALMVVWQHLAWSSAIPACDSF